MRMGGKHCHFKAAAGSVSPGLRSNLNVGKKNVKAGKCLDRPSGRLLQADHRRCSRFHALCRRQFGYLARKRKSPYFV